MAEGTQAIDIEEGASTNSVKKCPSYEVDFVGTCMVVAACAYILLHVIVHFGSDENICSTDFNPTGIVKTFTFGEISVSFVSSLLLIQRYRISSSSMDLTGDFMKRQYFNAFRISCLIHIFVLTSAIFVYFNTFNACSDPFGVELPATVWIEWCTAVPLMATMLSEGTISNVPTIRDLKLILSIFLCILFGWCASFNVSQEVGVILLGLACASYLFCAKVALFDAYRVNPIGMNTQNFIGPYNVLPESLQLNEKIRKSLVVHFIFFALPFFPIVYFCRASGVMSNELMYLVIVPLNVFAKGTFIIRAFEMSSLVIDELKSQVIVLSGRDKALKSFMRRTLHDVRIPLNTFVLGLDMMKDELNSKTSETESMMRESALFMSDTLNNVLSFAKIEEGAIEVNKELFSLSSSLERLRGTMRGLLDTKELNLAIETSKGFPREICTDQFKLEHVISNLLSNAIKFSENKSSIYISCSEGEGEKMKVESENAMEESFRSNILISIRDEGSGISEENIDKLFVPFKQIDANSTQAGGGTGLGLSIVHEMLQLLDGDISVESEVGKGTNFTINMNLICSNKRCDLPKDNPDITEIDDINDDSQLSWPPDKTNVLVVDDTASNRKILCQLLQNLKLNVLVAEDGLQAVKSVKEFEASGSNFHIIFMDNIMPNMSGLEASKELRSLGCTSIIIGITGNAMADDVKSFIEAGADLVLSKPLQFHTLKDVVKKVTKNKATHLDRQLFNEDSCVSFDIKGSAAKSGESIRAVDIV